MCTLVLQVRHQLSGSGKAWRRCRPHHHLLLGLALRAGDRKASSLVLSPIFKVKGQWRYLYRAIDKQGRTLGFYLSHTRSTAMAKRFLCNALKRQKSYDRPNTINTDKNPAYGAALKEMKDEGKCDVDLEHRQVKYLNNRLEADHGKLKRLIHPARGFKSMKTAYATIKGFEVMRMFRKGKCAPGIKGEVYLIEKQFGLDSKNVYEELWKTIHKAFQTA